jgi:hypothetical protein
MYETTGPGPGGMNRSESIWGTNNRNRVLCWVLSCVTVLGTVGTVMVVRATGSDIRSRSAPMLLASCLGPSVQRHTRPRALFGPTFAHRILQRAIILALVFLIDFCYFEQSGNDRNNQIFTM